MESNGKFITLATTLYAPNEKDSNINFFRIFFYHLRDFKCEEIIVVDFNLVLDIDIDKKDGRYRRN